MKIDISRKRIPKTKKLAMQRALEAMSKYIRKRDNYICISCRKNLIQDPNRDRKIDCGHLFSRRYKYILFNEKNTNGQCVYCNRYLHGNWDEYYKAFVEKYGMKEYEKLEADKNKLVKYTIESLFNIEKYFILLYNKLIDKELL